MKQFTGCLIGMMGGLFGGLCGVGGGAVIIPLMTRFVKATQHQAHGTSLFVIVFISLAGAGAYLLHDNVSWGAAMVIAASAIVTARFGALFAHSLPEKKLKNAFGFFLLFVSIMLIAKGYLPKTGFALSMWSRIIVFLLIGSATGFISGMMGIGGGAIMISLLVIIGNMEQHLAQGTSLLAMIPLSISGSATYYRRGNVQMNIAGGLILGSLIGSFFGATAASMLPEAYLRFLFAAIGLYMGVQYARA